MAKRAFGVIGAIPQAEVLSLQSHGIVLELPAPPSINRAGAEWRLGNKASRVVRWRRAADGHLLFTRQNRKLGQPIKGDFAINIVWDRSLKKRGSDIDNRIKYLLDYLQYLGVFGDDWLCSDMHVGYGNVMRNGCRVQLQRWESSHEPWRLVTGGA